MVKSRASTDPSVRSNYVFIYESSVTCAALFATARALVSVVQHCKDRGVQAILKSCNTIHAPLAAATGLNVGASSSTTQHTGWPALYRHPPLQTCKHRDQEWLLLPVFAARRWLKYSHLNHFTVLRSVCHADVQLRRSGGLLPRCITAW